ncbi:MAG: hypothetical protein FJ272_21595 [Planctomycetes bacterium]|nr:hypothetical protein [Planctomycetota bacterium]
MAEVQQELAQLRAAKPLTAEQWWAARRERVRAENMRLLPLMDGVFKDIGAVGEPLGAEKVQAMIAACGVKPEDNLFSRAIIEMREE